MPLQATSGAASYDAFGGGVPVEPNYIESCFSTWLYTGTSASQTITNGIDLSTKGGLVWVKRRNAEVGHNFYDTARGRQWRLDSSDTVAQTGPSSAGNDLASFNTTGFSLGPEQYANMNDGGGYPYTSWTFRKQPKFFDVVTYTGNDVGGRTVPHNLGSAPGCMIIKRTDVDGYFWVVYHRGANGGVDPEQYYIKLNATDALSGPNSSVWNNTAPTSTNFTLGTASAVNLSGATYVAYLFAHNAGGFGLTGTDNVISCGSYTTNGSGVATVDLGYEPQWVLTKATSGTFGTTDWVIADNMRGMPAPPQTDGVGGLFPNLSNAEDNNFNRSVHPTSTGFVANQYNSTPYIYIAIRRGPMKVPTSGTSVFQPIAYTGNGTSQSITTGITGDLTYIKYRTDGGAGNFFFDRLRNPKAYLDSSSTAAEVTGTQHITAFNQLGFSVGNNGNVNDSGGTFISQTFRRAPSFFDEVCYTGTGSATTQTHNLGVVPELIFIKCRSAANGGLVYNKTIGASKYLELFFTGEGDYAAQGPDSGPFNSTEPTSSVFSVGTYSNTNGSGATYVAYLFATCAGVSKVGTYTGTGTTLQIDCGFTAGARFVLIKRTSYPASGSVAGGWFVWDSARGIVAGNDPYLLLNSTAAEVTNTDYVDTYNAGFEISSTAPIQINESGKTYIFLAIA